LIAPVNHSEIKAAKKKIELSDFHLDSATIVTQDRKKISNRSKTTNCAISKNATRKSEIGKANTFSRRGRSLLFASTEGVKSTNRVGRKDKNAIEATIEPAIRFFFKKRTNPKATQINNAKRVIDVRKTKR
jgi:hypothetical protein